MDVDGPTPSRLRRDVLTPFQQRVRAIQAPLSAAADDAVPSSGTIIGVTKSESRDTGFEQRGNAFTHYLTAAKPNSPNGGGGGGSPTGTAARRERAPPPIEVATTKELLAAFKDEIDDARKDASGLTATEKLIQTLRKRRAETSTPDSPSSRAQSPASRASRRRNETRAVQLLLDDEGDADEKQFRHFLDSAPSRARDVVVKRSKASDWARGVGAGSVTNKEAITAAQAVRSLVASKAEDGADSPMSVTHASLRASLRRPSHHPSAQNGSNPAAALRVDQDHDYDDEARVVRDVFPEGYFERYEDAAQKPRDDRGAANRAARRHPRSPAAFPTSDDGGASSPLGFSPSALRAHLNPLILKPGSPAAVAMQFPPASRGDFGGTLTMAGGGFVGGRASSALGNGFAVVAEDDAEMFGSMAQSMNPALRVKHRKANTLDVNAAAFTGLATNFGSQGVAGRTRDKLASVAFVNVIGGNTELYNVPTYMPRTYSDKPPLHAVWARRDQLSYEYRAAAAELAHAKSEAVKDAEARAAHVLVSRMVAGRRRREQRRRHHRQLATLQAELKELMVVRTLQESRRKAFVEAKHEEEESKKWWRAPRKHHAGGTDGSSSNDVSMREAPSEATTTPRAPGAVFRNESLVPRPDFVSASPFAARARDDASDALSVSMPRSHQARKGRDPLLRQSITSTSRSGRSHAVHIDLATYDEAAEEAAAAETQHHVDQVKHAIATIEAAIAEALANASSSSSSSSSSDDSDNDDGGDSVSDGESSVVSDLEGTTSHGPPAIEKSKPPPRPRDNTKDALGVPIMKGNVWLRCGYMARRSNHNEDGVARHLPTAKAAPPPPPPSLADLLLEQEQMRIELAEDRASRTMGATAPHSRLLGRTPDLSGGAMDAILAKAGLSAKTPRGE